MARGSKIIVSNNPRGVFHSGIIYGTPKPGTVMQIRVSAGLVNGMWTWEVYAPGTDGERRVIAVLLEDDLQGKLATDAYVSGTVGRLYTPIAGEEMNMLMADVAGTGDDHTIGETMIVDTGTGKLIATTGSPESEPFRLLETVTDPTADQLVWTMYTGY